MLRLRIILQSSYVYYLLVITALLLAFFRIYIIKYDSKYNINDNIVLGTITKIEDKETKYKLEIKAKEKIIAYYKKDNKPNLKLGMKLKLKGKLYEANNNTIPNSFNYKKYLNNHKIYYLMDVNKLDIININKNIIYKIKEYMNNRINDFHFTNDYLKALILSDLKDLEEDTYKSFQINGLLHLFSVSGMHLNLLSITILYLLNKTSIKEIFKYMIITLFLIIFCLVINTSASVYRSLLFFILLSINKLFDFNISTKNILFLTTFILIIYNPLYILDIGFQYSVITTYGLIISNKKNKTSIQSLLYTSFIAFIFSMPITLYNFYEISILTPINNLILGPLITYIIYPLSLITMIFKYTEPLLYFSLKPLELINNLLSSLKIFTIVIPKVNIIFYLTYYIFIILYIYSRNKKYLLTSILLIFSFKLKLYFDNNTYVHFLDVGQGDSILIYNKKETILIDTGGLYNYDVSNNTIQFFKSMGITKIDLLLLTHGDSDHMKDTFNISKNIKVKNIMLNNNELNDNEKEILTLGINRVNNYNSKLNFKIYNNYIGKDENSSSIISLLTINKTKILFMGDAPKEKELEWLKDNETKIDIIKLGHHGSKTSSDYNFLKNIEAKEAIVSSGRNNRFNHPSVETIETLDILNIKYYDTKTKGTISYIFRRNDYTKKLNLP